MQGRIHGDSVSKAVGKSSMEVKIVLRPSADEGMLLLGQMVQCGDRFLLSRLFNHSRKPSEVRCRNQGKDPPAKAQGSDRQV